MTNTESVRRNSRSLDLRELLEANLHALDALAAEQRRTIEATLRAVDGMRAELRAELRAFGDARAPWVAALAETRALLYVALQEVIIGHDGAGLSMPLPRQLSGI